MGRLALDSAASGDVLVHVGNDSVSGLGHRDQFARRVAAKAARDLRELFAVDRLGSGGRLRVALESFALRTADDGHLSELPAGSCGRSVFLMGAGDSLVDSASRPAIADVFAVAGRAGLHLFGRRPALEVWPHETHAHAGHVGVSGTLVRVLRDGAAASATIEFIRIEFDIIITAALGASSCDNRSVVGLWREFLRE